MYTVLKCTDAKLGMRDIQRDGQTNVSRCITYRSKLPRKIMEAYMMSTDNGGLEAEPPAGSRGRASGQGVTGGGEDPIKAQSILSFRSRIPRSS